MTYETAISALDAARTGDELIRVLDALGTKDHVLNPALVQQALSGGWHRSNTAPLPTFEVIEF